MKKKKENKSRQKFIWIILIMFFLITLIGSLIYFGEGLFNLTGLPILEQNQSNFSQNNSQAGTLEINETLNITNQLNDPNPNLGNFSSEIPPPQTRRGARGNGQTQNPSYSLINWKSKFDLYSGGRKIDLGELFDKKTRFGLYFNGREISSFDLDFSENIDLSDIDAEMDILKRKSFMHSYNGKLENITLMIPRMPSQSQVRICSNASSLDEVYKGCSELSTVTSEYVLTLGDQNLKISDDGLFFIISGITGTGGLSESVKIDWWNPNWIYRDEINITNLGDIPANYTLNFTINTLNLTEENKLLSNGNDLRIVWWNGTQNIELDRINNSAFNSSITDISFKIQKKINSTFRNETYFVYYGNNLASLPPKNKSKVFYYWEDFEDQSHELTNGPLLPTINANSKKNGNYGLEGDGLAGYRRAVKPDNIPRGIQIEGWVYSGYAGDNADLPGLTFGMQPTGDQKNGYQVLLDWRSTSGGSADMQIRENWGSGTPLDTSVENTVFADRWYYMKVLWKNNGDINATIYDSNMNYYGKLSANDPSYTSGYFGVGAYRDGFWDDLMLKLYLSSSPKVSLFGEEILGPRISNVNLNSSNIERYGKVNISANITSEKGMSSSWIQITLPNLTIQSYQMLNSSEIYEFIYSSKEIGKYIAKIYANDTGGSTSSSQEIVWNVYGLVKLNYIHISPENISQGMIVEAFCEIIDFDLLEGVENYPVMYYSNINGFLGTNVTNSTGFSRLEFTSYVLGIETITCNITNNETKYYNVTNEFSLNSTLNVSEAHQLLIVENSINKNKIGIGGTINITAQITSPNPIDTVFVNLTTPSNISHLLIMLNSGGNNYLLELNDTWEIGNYSLYIIANDSSSTIKNSSDNKNIFEVESLLTLSLGTNKNIYGTNQTVLLSTSTSDWWNTDWRYRKQLTIKNNDLGILRKEYSMNLTLDVGTLIGQGMLENDCSDLRIIYENGNENIELDRVNETTCSGISEIWFELQNNISSNGQDNNYYLYYGNPSAGTPKENRENIYLVWDDFESYNLDTTPGNGWTDDPEFSVTDWQIKSDSGNKVLQDMSNLGAYKTIYKGEDWWTDYRIEAKVKLDSFLFTGISFRRQPWSGSYFNHYSMITDDRAASNKLVIRKWSGGGSNFAAIATDATDFDGLSWHNYKIDILGRDISISRDGIEYIEYNTLTDGSSYNTGGFVGLMSHEGLTMFDDVKVMLTIADEPTISLGIQEENSVNSYLENEGDLNSYGYLIMEIEKNNSGVWENQATIINDSQTLTRRLISSNSSIDLSTIWFDSGSWKTNEEGEFRVRVRLVSQKEEILMNNSGNYLEEFSYFNIETSGPSIELISPINKRGFNSTQGIFYFNVTDESGIDYCNLIVNEKIKSTSNDVRSDQISQISIPDMHLGVNNWRIECYDSNGNLGESEQRKVIVSPITNFAGKTTDLSLIDVENIQNFLIEKPKFGMINFTQSINLSNGFRFDSYVIIGNNFIEIDSENIPELNKSAILTIYNLSLENPVILKNGRTCVDCGIIDYTLDKNLTFFVNSFSNYSATENSQLEIWDETDYSRDTGENISFYANYTNTTSGSPITLATCAIDFLDLIDSMNYNSDSGLFEYERNLPIGVNNYNITCSAPGYTTIFLKENSNVEGFHVPSGANITEIKSSRGPTFPAGNNNAKAGNITELEINGKVNSQYWQGYYGNISGVIELVDSNQNVFYNWSDQFPTGEVYATRAYDVNFATIACADSTDISIEESLVGQNSNDSDSITNTFTLQTHPTFYSGLNQITEDSCPSTNVYDNSGIQNSYFYEILLSDAASNIVYTSIIENNIIGFNSKAHDFEMIVAENGKNANIQTTPYYFYLELY